MAEPTLPGTPLSDSRPPRPSAPSSPSGVPLLQRDEGHSACAHTPSDRKWKRCKCDCFVPQELKPDDKHCENCARSTVCASFSWAAASETTGGAGHDVAWHTEVPLVRSSLMGDMKFDINTMDGFQAASKFLDDHVKKLSDTPQDLLKQVLNHHTPPSTRSKDCTASAQCLMPHSPNCLLVHGCARTGRALLTGVYEQAIQKQQTGDRDAAVEYYERLLKVDPESAGGLVRYGMLLMDEHNYKKAQPLLKRAVGLGGSDNAHAIRAYAILTTQMAADRRWNTAMGVSKAANKFKGLRGKKASNMLADLVIPTIPSAAAEAYLVPEGKEAGDDKDWLPPVPSSPPMSPFKNRSSMTEGEKQEKMAKMRAQIAERNAAAVVAKEEAERDDDLACLVLSRKNCFRQLMISLASAKWFERLTILAIFGNCVSLAMYDPADKECVTSRCELLELIEKGFTLFFTLEMVTKMFAMGVTGETGYLSDAWNRFDFMIVLVSLIDLLPFDLTGGLNSLRAFRALRPLRAVTKVAGLRILVALIIDTLPMVGRAFLVITLICYAFSVVGLQLWKDGMLHSRCVDSSGAIYTPNITNLTTLQFAEINLGAPVYYCSYDDYWGLSECPPAGDGSYGSCSAVGGNPYGGIISFDNIGTSWMAVFMTVTLDTWSELQSALIDTHSPLVFLFFLPLVFLGNFFGINLFLVIINNQYGDIQRREFTVVRAFDKKRQQIVNKRESDSVDLAVKLACETIGEVGVQLRCAGLAAQAKWVTELEEDINEVEDKVKLVQEMERIKHVQLQLDQSIESGKPGLLSAASALRSLPKQLDYILHVKHAGANVPPACLFVYREMSKVMYNCEMGSYPCVVACKTWFNGVVLSENFSRIVMGMIVLNTLVMASVHHNQMEMLDMVQPLANTIFVVFFLLELIVKHIALGFGAYWDDGWNRFDGIIVLASIADMVLLGMSGAGGSFISVFRALRILRIFKMVKFLPGLNKQLEVVARAIGHVGYLFLLLSMFIFTYAILGMVLFGDVKTDTSYRPNFDSLEWSLLAVLEVVTLDRWSVIMGYAVQRTNDWSSIYFVSLIVLTRFFLFNMFVTVILQGFAEMRIEEEEDLLNYDGRRRKRNGEAVELLTIMNESHVKPKQRLFFLEWKAIALLRNSSMFTIPQWREFDDQRIFDKIKHHLAGFQLHGAMRLRNEMFAAWADPDAYQAITWGRKEDGAGGVGELMSAEIAEGGDARAILDRAAAVLWGASAAPDAPVEAYVDEEVPGLPELDWSLTTEEEDAQSSPEGWCSLDEKQRSPTEEVLINNKRSSAVVQQRNETKSARNSGVAARAEQGSAPSAAPMPPLVGSKRGSKAAGSKGRSRGASLTVQSFLDVGGSEQLFEQYDANNDGVLESGEVDEMLDAGVLKERQVNEMLDLFASMNDAKAEFLQSIAEEDSDDEQTAPASEPLNVVSNPLTAGTVDDDELEDLVAEALNDPEMDFTATDHEEFMAEAMLQIAEEEATRKKAEEAEEATREKAGEAERIRAAEQVAKDEKAAKKAAEEEAAANELQRLADEVLNDPTFEADFGDIELDALVDEAMNDADFGAELTQHEGADDGSAMIDDLLQDLEGGSASGSALGTGAGRGRASGVLGETVGAQGKENDWFASKPKLKGDKVKDITKPPSDWGVPTTNKRLKDNSETWRPSSAEKERREERGYDPTIGASTLIRPPTCCENKTLCCLGPKNKFRLWAERVVKNWWFDQGILVLIAASAVIMAIDRPSIEDASAERWLLDALNAIFVLIFTAEMVIKIMALGLFGTDEAYLKSGWNRLDGFVVLTSWIYLVAAIDQLRILRILRLLRAVRPLRAIQRLPALRMVCNSLIASAPAVGHAMLVSSTFMLVFSILGVQLFAGTYYYCSVGQYGKEACEAACAEGQTCWQNNVLNFDNVLNAALLIFFVALGDWGAPMLNAVDSRGVDESPERNSNVLNALFFILVMFVFYFFLFNLFLGALQDSYTRLYAQEEGIAAGLISRDDDFDNKTLDLVLSAEATALKLENQKIARKVAIVEAYNTGKQLARPSSTPSFDATVAPADSSDEEEEEKAVPLARPHSMISNSPTSPTSPLAAKRASKLGLMNGVKPGGGSRSGSGIGSGAGVEVTDEEAAAAVREHNALVRRRSNAEQYGVDWSTSGDADEVSGQMDGDVAAVKEHNMQVRRNSVAQALGVDEDGREVAVAIRRLNIDEQEEEQRLQADDGIAARIVRHKNFDAVVAGAIMLNVVFMSCDYYEMSGLYETVLDLAAYVFVTFFTLEMLIKIKALGCGDYISDSWNQFDAVVVAVSVLSIVLETLIGSDLINPSLLRCLRLVRIARLIKVMKISEGVQAIMQTLAHVLPQLANLSLLLALMIFVYACAGVELFGKMTCTTASPCAGFSEHAKFTNFLWAVVTLLRVLTCDAVPDLLRDAMKASPDCDDSVDCPYGNNCCVQYAALTAPVYFVSFLVLARLLLLNVVVVMMIEQFNKATEDLLLSSITAETSMLDDMTEAEQLEALGLSESSLDDIAMDLQQNMSSLMIEKQVRDVEAAQKQSHERGYNAKVGDGGGAGTVAALIANQYVKAVSQPASRKVSAAPAFSSDAFMESDAFMLKGADSGAADGVQQDAKLAPSARVEPEDVDNSKQTPAEPQVNNWLGSKREK